jgi:hypothetical protein
MLKAWTASTSLASLAVESVECGASASIFNPGSIGVNEFFESVKGMFSDVTIGKLGASAASF